MPAMQLVFLQAGVDHMEISDEICHKPFLHVQNTYCGLNKNAGTA